MRAMIRMGSKAISKVGSSKLVLLQANLRTFQDDIASHSWEFISIATSYLVQIINLPIGRSAMFDLLHGLDSQLQ